MALSGSYTFTLNRNEMIDEALENIGVKPLGDEATPEMVETSVRTLQLMLKSLQAQGLTIWTWREAELPLVADAQSYTLGPLGTAFDVLLDPALIPNPIEINDVRLKDTSGNERPCNLISISEYKNYVNKAAEGKIVNISFHEGVDNSVLYVWPVNADTTDVLVFQFKQPVDDVNSDTDNFAFPADRLEAVTLHLTSRLAAKFQLPLAERAYWDAMAKRAWDEISDTEDNTSFFIQPNLRG